MGEKGSVHLMFSKIDINDSFVLSIIKEHSLSKKRDFLDVKQEIAANIELKKESYNYSTILYENMLSNIVESIVFYDYMEFDEEVLFNEDIFYRLKNMIVVENQRLFPLRDGYSKRKVIKTNWFIVPTNGLIKLPPKMEECPTAMVNNRGDFVFNRLFCEKLCVYAKKKQIKPHGKKYQSNGGSIPDYYEYIEFLILHEFMHIIHGDIFYVKKFKSINGNIQNIVGDYIINYKLVKQGFNQPPIGLFNEYINYDKQSSIEDMRDVVIEELSKGLKDEDTLGQLGNSFDQHNNNEISSEDKVDENSEIDDSVDENQEKTETMGESNQDVIDEVSSNDNEVDSLTSDNQQELSRDASSFELEDTYLPQYKWNQLIKLLLPADDMDEDYSYSKMSNKTITCLKQLKDVGVSSTKPGLLKMENDKKGIFFIIDNSGSVIKELEYINKELLNILRNKNSSLIDIYILKFDSKSKLFKLNLKNDTYSEIEKIQDFLENGFSGTHVKKHIKNIFVECSWGGSTNLKTEIVDSAIKMWSKEYNIVLFSDTDIINDKDNYANLLRLTKTTTKRKNSFAIITTKSSYKEYKSLSMNNVLLSSF